MKSPIESTIIQLQSGYQLIIKQVDIKKVINSLVRPKFVVLGSINKGKQKMDIKIKDHYNKSEDG